MCEGEHEPLSVTETLVPPAGSWRTRGVWGDSTRLVCSWGDVCHLQNPKSYTSDFEGSRTEKSVREERAGHLGADPRTRGWVVLDYDDSKGPRSVPDSHPRSLGQPSDDGPSGTGRLLSGRIPCHPDLPDLCHDDPAVSISSRRVRPPCDHGSTSPYFDVQCAGGSLGGP